MTKIKIIKCPILNACKDYKLHSDQSVLEVALAFEEVHNSTDLSAAKPIAIMCNEYDSNKRKCSIKKSSCTYSSWKEL